MTDRVNCGYRDDGSEQMTMTTLNSIFTYTAVIAALLTAISTIGLWWTGSIIDSRKRQEIADLHKSLASVQPRSINSAQREALVSRLSGHEKMKIGLCTKIFDQ